MMKTANVPMTNAQLIAEAVEEVRSERHPSWSRDQLLCHPQEAIELCQQVRIRLPMRTTNYEILWTWLNANKRGRISPRRSK